MLTYVVTSDTDRVIDFLGVFAAGEQQVFGQTAADHFHQQKGVPLNQSNVPEGVQVVIYVTPDEGAGEESEDVEPFDHNENTQVTTTDNAEIQVPTVEVLDSESDEEA
jgi:hypothetical protein